MPRTPQEHDATSLLRTIAIKDATLREMEHALLAPPPPELNHLTSKLGLSRKGVALLANMRRREAVLRVKLRALTLELDAFRHREQQAVELNGALREQRDAARADADVLALRREVRVLRADLNSSLAREAALQDELLVAKERIGHAEGQLVRGAAIERQMRYDLEQVADVALHAMSARAAVALGEADGARVHAGEVLARGVPKPAAGRSRIAGTSRPY